jgi:hypothetical protein
MCRDQLAKSGRPVLHLLDILFPKTAHPANEPSVSISGRRLGRRHLKADLLARYSGAELPPKEPWEDLALSISKPVAVVLEERRILEDDIRRVLFLARQKGSYLVHGADGRRIASARLGEVTFWVEYRDVDGIYHIDRCWSHRMVIAGGRQ